MRFQSLRQSSDLLTQTDSCQSRKPFASQVFPWMAAVAATYLSETCQRKHLWGEKMRSGRNSIVRMKAVSRMDSQ